MKNGSANFSKSEAIISELLKNVKESTGECIWIEGYHHQFSSNANFYDAPLESYKNELK